MECGPMVCYSMGAINSLVDKITQMMTNHPLKEGLLQDLKRLREDPMNKFARAKVVGDQVKVWMKQVRELVYDMEDWIDLKQEEAADFSDEEDKLQIEEFKELIHEAICRCEKYELFKQVEFCSAAHVCGDVAGRRRLLPEEVVVLVGLQVPKSELRDLMMDGQKQLKVVSILGQEGIGKTTLAKAIYEDVKGQFMCQGFVSVGRPTSVKTTLVEILRQVKPEADDQEALEKQMSEIIAELWTFLLTKRYFICIDDVRDTRELEVIKCALPNNKDGSRILTTTRKEDIAKLCSRRPKDVVYEMSALKDNYPNMLFRSCVDAEEQNWPDLLKGSSERMFKVCGGVPLAIITSAGGLLGRTSEEQELSEQLNRTVLSELDKLHPESQAIRKVLNICYGDLPLPLKSCLLYMTAFPGNYDIKKDRLIRRWVAEGIIPDRHGKSSWETAESYFDELVCRRLIHPIFDYSDGEATRCNVQGAVYDFLESLATKENFVTAGVELMSGTFPCDRVRRVGSIHFDVEEEVDTMFSNSNTYCLLDDKSLVDSISAGQADEANSWQLPGVRSLAFSGDAGRIPELLPAFRHLRVLDLEDSKGLVEEQLESIGGLSQLRYLALGRTNVNKLPAEIVALKLLSTLDLRGSMVRHLPEIWDGKLVSLLGDQLILRGEMRGVEKLEEVSKVVLGPDGSPADSMARLVRESSQLRMLGVTFSRLHGQSAIDRQRVQHFLTAVGESKLQSLVLDNYLQPLLEMLAHSLLSASNHLQKLEVRVAGSLPQVPEEMGYLKALTHLHINVQAVEAQAVRVLGSLPRLVLLVLELDSLTSPSSLQVSGEDGGFPSLEVLWYKTKYGAGMGLRFKKGDEQPPMPKLRRLRVDIDARETRCRYDAFDLGIEDLPCLVRVHATIDWKNATLTPSEVEAVEKDIRNQVSQNPNNPVLELNRSRQRPVPRAAEVIVINSLDEWDKQIGCNKWVLIHFTASWCTPSRKMAPFFASLAKSFPDVVFLKVDVGRGKLERIGARYGITALPTFLFMKGEHTKCSVVGEGPDKRQELEHTLNKLLSQ